MPAAGKVTRLTISAMHIVTDRMNVHLMPGSAAVFKNVSRRAGVYHIEKARNSDAGPPFNKPLPIWT